MFKPLLYHHIHLLLYIQWFMISPSFCLLNQWLICCVTHHQPCDEVFILRISAANVSAEKKSAFVSQHQSD